jgi:hypothetical protein
VTMRLRRRFSPPRRTRRSTWPRLDEAIDLIRAAPAAAVRHGSATLLAECLVMEAHGHTARVP